MTETTTSRFVTIPVTRTGVKRNLPEISATFAPKSGALILAFSPEFCDKYEAEHGHFRGEAVLCGLDNYRHEMQILVVEKGTPGARTVAKRQGVEGGAQITITAHNLPEDMQRWEGRNVCTFEHTDEGLIIDLIPYLGVQGEQ